MEGTAEGQPFPHPVSSRLDALGTRVQDKAMRQVLKIPGAKRNLTAMGPLPRPVHVRLMGRAGEGGVNHEEGVPTRRLMVLTSPRPRQQHTPTEFLAFTSLVIVRCRHAVGFASLVPDPNGGAGIYGGGNGTEEGRLV